MKTQSHEQTTDTQLVDRAKAGHWDAFETLTTRYEQAVYSLAVRVLWDARLAEEVTQRTFIAAIKGLKALPRQTGFGAWLLSLASHEILKLARLRPACGKEQADTPSDSGCSRRLWTQLNVSESAISA
ncbi:MAG TPA: sigma factor, partial [Clostridia bacterium]|nr:sigma factor [Clostridia bacterium]